MLVERRGGQEIWRYDHNNVRPHSSLENQAPAETRRTLEQSEGSAPDALAQPKTNQYQPKGLSIMDAGRPWARSPVLRERLKKLARVRRRFDYRRLHVFLRRKVYEVNHKRLLRTYREDGGGSGNDPMDRFPDDTPVAPSRGTQAGHCSADFSVFALFDGTDHLSVDLSRDKF